MCIYSSFVCIYCHQMMIAFRALIGHVDGNPNVIFLEDSGAGGIEEMAKRLEDSNMQYALGAYIPPSLH